MSHDRFVYVIYIRAPQEKVWRALREPEFTKVYWSETWQDSDWQVGSSWKLMIPDGRVGDAGRVLEIESPNRLVIEWQNQFIPEIQAEGPSRLTIELETIGDAVRVALTHEIDIDPSKLIAAVSMGWPMILSSLKSLLETGDSLADSKKWPEGH